LSDEFLRVARKEVAEDITEVGNLLKKCQNDSDISKNAVDVEKHIHKLKGLSPMMGQVEIGELAALVDKLLKAVISGKVVPGIYVTVKDSNVTMQQLLNGTKVDFISLKSQIEKNYESFLH
jgi:chemotaxis protein histidine kinase CheA